MQHKDTKRITIETKRITTKTIMQTDEEIEQKIKEHKDTTSEDVSDNLRRIRGVIKSLRVDFPIEGSPISFGNAIA